MVFVCYLFIMSCGIFSAPVRNRPWHLPVTPNILCLLWSLLSVVSSDNGIDAVILWAVCYLRAGEFTRDALAIGMCLHWFT